MPVALGDWWTAVLLRPQKAVFAAYLHLWCVKFLKREATFEKLTFLFFYQPQFLLFFTFSDFISLFFACILFIYTRFVCENGATLDWIDKETAPERGLGLKVIRQIVERYGNLSNTEYGEDYYKVKVLIPLRQPLK